MTVRILVGHCLDVLRSLPAESVNCVVTSPPYYGLRSYGTNPQVWGDNSDCDHDWQPVGKKGYGTGQGFTNADPGFKRPLGFEAKAGNVLTSGQCSRCGAWLGELGAEPTPDLYVQHIVEVFRGIRRVLRRDGTCWLNLGSSFASQPFKPWGIKPKDELMIPHRVAMALIADGWYLRQAITWCKTAPMPESVTDRPTSATEMLFLLTRSARYFYDAEAVRVPYAMTSWTAEREMAGELARGRDGIRSGPKGADRASGAADGQRSGSTSFLNGGYTQGGRNLWNYWLLGPESFPGSHFAVMPTDLVEPCLKAGCPERCCHHCGKGWRRVVERTTVAKDRQTGKGWQAGIIAHDCWESGTPTHSGLANAEYHTARTLGWQQACTCPPHEPVPGVALDPFGGAGTVGLVADRLGRDAVLIELNPTYAAMARERIEAEAGMFAAVEVVA